MTKLPSYLHKLKETNLRLITYFVTDFRGNFKYMYMALATSIEGCKHYKPIMIIDGTFFDSAHGGILITTCK